MRISVADYYYIQYEPPDNNKINTQISNSVLQTHRNVFRINTKTCKLFWSPVFNDETHMYSMGREKVVERRVWNRI